MLGRISGEKWKDVSVNMDEYLILLEVLMEDNYKGDMILIDRLSEFFHVNSWSWNEGEVVELDDITCVIHDGQARGIRTVWR